MGSSRHAAIPAIAGFTTVALHLLLLTPALWGESASPPPRAPDAFGAGANAGSPAGSATEKLILIDLPTDLTSPEESFESQMYARLEAPPSILQITGPDDLPLKPLETSTEGEAEEASEADLIARTKLIGIYEGQIRARIERAWRRPRETLAQTEFSCRVKIRQDKRGSVLEVEIERCNGNLRWEASLVSAINAASPLPAPPNAEVFVDAFSMSFRSSGYTGSSNEGFEPDLPSLAVAHTTTEGYPVASPRAGESRVQAMPVTDGIIELRGTGNQVTWTVVEQEAPVSTPSE